VNRQRIYFANHTSNADLPIVWTVLPPALRRVTRPVAAADYWLKTKARAFIGPEVFRAILIDRGSITLPKPGLRSIWFQPGSTISLR